MKLVDIYALSSAGIPTGSKLVLTFEQNAYLGAFHLKGLAEHSWITLHPLEVNLLDDIIDLEEWPGGKRTFTVLTTQNFDLSKFADRVGRFLEDLEIKRP